MNIYFDVASYSISATELDKIQNISDGQLFLIKGHTDSDGNDNYNQELSKNRVQTVYDNLIQLGISPSKIDMEYFGESRPVNQNLNPSEKQNNRRVELIYDTDFLLDKIVETQTFSVNKNQLIEFTTENKVRFIIQPNTFTEDVELEVREYFSLEDIISNKLSTALKDGNLLETGGMFNINALNKDGKELAPTKDIEMNVESLNLESGFELFSGDRNDKLVMEWVDLSESKPSFGLNTSEQTIVDTLVLNYSGWQYDWMWFTCSQYSPKYSGEEIVDRWMDYSAAKVRSIAYKYPDSEITNNKFRFKYTFQKGNIKSKFTSDAFDMAIIKNPMTKEDRVLVKEYKLIHAELKEIAMEFIKQEKIKSTHKNNYFECYIEENQEFKNGVPIFSSNDDQEQFIEKFNLPQLGWINIDMLLKEKEKCNPFCKRKAKSRFKNYS